MKLKLLYLSLFLLSYVNAKNNFVTLAPSTDPTPRKTLTMHEAVHKAFTYRPSLQALKQAVSTLRLQEKMAWTGYFPSVTLTTDISQYQNDHGLKTNANLQATQLLFNFGGPQRQYKQATKNTAVEELGEQAAKNAAQLAVETCFLHAWRIQQQQETMHALHHSSQLHFDKAQNQKNVDLLRKKDFLLSEQTHEDTIACINNYEHDASLAQANLEFLIGQSCMVSCLNNNAKKPTTRLIWNNRHDLTVKKKEWYIEKALNHRPEIQQDQKRMEYQIEEIKLAASTRLPSVYLHGSVGYDARYSEDFTAPIGSLRKSTQNIGVSFSWNIFDSLVSDCRIKLAESRKLEHLLKKQETINKIKNEVTVAYTVFQKEHNKLQALRFSYKRAANEFASRKLEYSSGLLSDVEFEAATLEWKNARFSWLNQIVETAIKKRELLSTCGYFQKL